MLAATKDPVAPRRGTSFARIPCHDTNTKSSDTRQVVGYSTMWWTFRLAFWPPNHSCKPDATRSRSPICLLARCKATLVRFACQMHARLSARLYIDSLLIVRNAKYVLVSCEAAALSLTVYRGPCKALLSFVRHVAIFSQASIVDSRYCINRPPWVSQAS